MAGSGKAALVAPPPVKKGGFELPDIASKLGNFAKFSGDQQEQMLNQLAAMGPPPPVQMPMAPPVNTAGTALVANQMQQLLGGSRPPMALPNMIKSRGEAMTDPTMGLGLV